MMNDSEQDDLFDPQAEANERRTKVILAMLANDEYVDEETIEFVKANVKWKHDAPIALSSLKPPAVETRCAPPVRKGEKTSGGRTTPKA